MNTEASTPHNLVCAGCGHPLEWGPSNAHFRQYLHEPGLVIGDIICDSPECPSPHNWAFMPFMADIAKHRGCTVVALDRDPPPEVWHEARSAGVTIWSIGRMRISGPATCDRPVPGVRLFTPSESDPSAEIALAEQQVRLWSEDLPASLVLDLLHMIAA